MQLHVQPKPHDLASAIAEGDIRVLVMVLFHMTGDGKWLEPPYAPRRDVRLIPDPSARLPDHIQQDIRSAVVALYEHGTPAPAITHPDNALLLKMMSTTLGETVAPEYAAMMQEEMGFAARDPQWTTQPSPDKLQHQNVLIVGAGVSAIALGVTLGQLGIPYEIVEKNADLGGTWFNNRYPGCGVDTPNHSYSFSFGTRNKWTRYFAQRREIHAYLSKVSREYDVTRHMRFNTKLTSTRWDETTKRWVSTLEDSSGTREVTSAFLVSAIGQLNEPRKAHFNGEDNFKGQIIHSTEWAEDTDITGKRIAVIGTGATAMQLVPSIANDVARVTVYQRTAQWARPVAGYADPISDGAQWLLEHLPFYVKWYRFNMFWRYGDGLLPFLRKDPDWPFPDRATNKGNDRHREELTAFIKSELATRPDLIAKCIPTYPPYGKRILLDNDWFKTLLKPNVELVTEGIDHFTETGIVTSDGELREADIIVVSTGFKLTELTAALNVSGRDGKNLKEAWADDNPTAYLGINVPDFPNLFLMLGPNTGPAHGGSVIFTSECQSRFIGAALVKMIEGEIAAIDVKRSAHDDYVARVDAEHEQLIWTHPGMSTYYRNTHGRVFSAMPWRFVDYWAMTHDPDFAQYEMIKA